MNQKKILAAALCGSILFSVGSVPAAAEEESGYKAGKENGLTDISAIFRECTQDQIRKMSAMVKAAVQVAKAEGEAQKAAQAAAAETKAKQESGDVIVTADERVVPNPVYSTPDNYEPYVEMLYMEKEPAAKAETDSDIQAAEEIADAADTTFDEVIYAEPVYAEPVYYEPVYYEPVYTYTEPVYTEPVYTEPVNTEPVNTEPAYTEPVNTDPAYTEPAYTEPAYTEPVSTEPVYEEPVAEVNTEAAAADPVPETAAYEDTSYLDNTYTEDYYTDGTGTAETVAHEARATASDSDLDLLASIIYCEAGGESYEGQVAVGAVVLNRMESDLYPDDMSDVIYQSGQFTPAMTGWLDQVRSSGVPDYCYDAAQAALNGENPVGDCLYFHAGGGDGLTIGNQTFY